MRAVVKSAPRDGSTGTTVKDCDRPVPGPGEVLIKVAAAALCGTDKHIWHWDPSIRRSMQLPRIYGHEFCGHLEEIGPHTDRTDLAPGDYVSAEMHVVCGHCRQCRNGQGHVCSNTRVLGLHGDGAFAEYVKVPATNVIKLDRESLPLKVGAFLDALGNAVHATQVSDLAGKSVLITGFGPIGAMCAAIAEHCGAGTVIVTDVSDHSLETARRWAAAKSFRNLHAFNAAASDPKSVREAILDLTDGGIDVALEMSGAPAAINFALDVVAMGGFVSLLGLPAGHSLQIDDYTTNVILKGITLQGITGRRMYATWERMLSLLKAGLDVAWVVQGEYDSLDDFEQGIDKFDRHEALKVIFYPHGRNVS
ncbi:MAG: alcohol dehydrogenase catalytic domain-containing protein [Thermoanaerobaculia bacterium]|nr:alcohol dehydrogenase catalytic domain-containing protein [Thermoanaerobaculia bacterium]